MVVSDSLLATRYVRTSLRGSLIFYATHAGMIKIKNNHNNVNRKVAPTQTSKTSNIICSRPKIHTRYDVVHVLRSLIFWNIKNEIYMYSDAGISYTSCMIPGTWYSCSEGGESGCFFGG